MLNVAGYFDELDRFLDNAVREGFVTEQHRELLLLDDDPARLVARLRAHQPGESEQWIGRTNR
jgi:predicted Rossmann-fold nucleotide-binding protein